MLGRTVAGQFDTRVFVRSVPFSRQRPRGRIDRLNSGDRRRSVTVVYRMFFFECWPPGAPGGFFYRDWGSWLVRIGGVTTTPPLVIIDH